MARLTAQVEEMEEELAMYQAQCGELNEENARLRDEVCDLEDQLADYEEYIKWIEETYTDARTAYDAKQRLDQAS